MSLLYEDVPILWSKSLYLFTLFIYFVIVFDGFILCFTTAVKPSMFKELLDYANVEYWISSLSLLGKAPHLLLLPFFFLVFSRQKINNNNCYY